MIWTNHLEANLKVAILGLFSIAFMLICTSCVAPNQEVVDLPEKKETEEVSFEGSGRTAEPTLQSYESIYYIDYAHGTIPISDLPIGSKVFDPSWLWQFRTGSGYTPKAGDFKKPVIWIVVAKDHYNDHEPHVTLISEEVVGFYTFDVSTDRSAEGESHWYSHNHWGKSGTTNAMNGLRPWLNSTGIHSGEGFYEAFSSNFKNAIISTTLPNRNWEDGEAYIPKIKSSFPQLQNWAIHNLKIPTR